MAIGNRLHIELDSLVPKLYDQHGNVFGELALAGADPSVPSIGATVEVYGIVFAAGGVGHVLPLDPADVAHVAYYFSSGLSLNVAKTKFVIPRDGRWLMTGVAFVPSHATDWNLISQFGNGWNGEVGALQIPPDSVTGAAYNATVHMSSIAELTEGTEVGWQLTAAGPGFTLLDSYLSLHYLGPKAE